MSDRWEQDDNRAARAWDEPAPPAPQPGGQPDWGRPDAWADQPSLDQVGQGWTQAQRRADWDPTTSYQAPTRPGPPSYPPPSPQSAWPPPTIPPPVPPKPRRSHRGLVAGLVGLLVVGLVAWAVLVPLLNADRQADPAPLPTSSTAATVPPGSSPPPSALSSPSATPTRKFTPPTDERHLTKNAIYALKPPVADCPRPRLPASERAYRRLVEGLVKCQNEAWTKAFADVGYELAKVEVQFYKNSVSTPCGAPSKRFPAFYCSTNHAMYFSRAAYDTAHYYRLSIVDAVFHEYAHHIQEEAHILVAADHSDESQAVVTRRIELQATCMAAIADSTMNGIGFSQQDEVELRYQYSHGGEEVHGSNNAQSYWGPRGFRAKTMGACNTWKAPASKVK